jgi:RimJ/RimL family protein N-acetyltransferase
LRSLDQPRLLVNERVQLRPWRTPDFPGVVEAFGCPDIQRWHHRRVDSDHEARAWIANWDESWKEETAVSWAIVGNDDKLTGQVGLRGISLFDASAELSYWVVPSARGAGIAGKAVQAVAKWSFSTVGMHRLFLQHSTANGASCRVAEKAGFRPEGTLRSAMLHADGWHDVHLHAQLRNDVLAS